MPILNSRTALPCLILCVCPILLGCQQKDEIRQYRVAKEVSVASRPASRRNQQPVWFVKLTGTESGLTEALRPFIGMISEFKLSDGQPDFALPEGWTSSPGPAPVAQTIQTTADPAEATVTLTELPAPTKDPEGYLFANYNRWRGQLGLPPLSEAEGLQGAVASGDVIPASRPGTEHSTTLVRLTGQTEKYGKTMMLVAVISETPLVSASPAASAPQSTASPLDYELPEGWSEKPGNAMRIASLGVESEAGNADISVISLPGGGDVLPNINRWRGQVKLEEINDEELDELLEKVEIDGHTGQLAMLEGESQSILAAIIEIEGVKWFFKMQGATPVVKAEAQNFRDWLASIKLPAG